MGKTYRRNPWYPVVKGVLGKKCHRDASCRPGCVICNNYKPFKRTEKRIEKRKAMKRELDDN